MSDDDNPEVPEITSVVEALLNLVGQVAELQLDDDSRETIYDMCDIVATHHGIPRFDAVMEPQEDGTVITRYYGSADEAARSKPQLKLVVDNPEIDDDDTTIH